MLDFADQISLNFDEYYRFRAVAELIGGMGKRGLSVLDVGGGAGRFLGFIPEHRALSVDKQQGIDGTNLPYADRSYDVVTSIDALEHVVRADRSRFIRELVRVSRRKVLLAFPHQEATEATEIVNRFTRDWLREHIDKGLPSAADVQQVLNRLPVTCRVHTNLSLDFWVAATIAEWYAPWELKRPLNEDLNRLYRAVAPGEACYRLIFEINV